ncbi:unnamed protein product [Spodoptera littoralis]|uniref:Uncharacterized protein n=1 Tax=Spodoptera littoralis TaxID=7109 RepID=A0A9P0IAA0_SPOLI|nr:unnamed protein product [Spodoptera littoralis]CAH1643148.1 unnamed protein product [Spodoptera littoralis]
MRSQILYLLLGSCLLAVASAAEPEGTCANVKTIFEKNGMLTAVDLQAQPNSGKFYSSPMVIQWKRQDQAIRVLAIKIDFVLRAQVDARFPNKAYCLIDRPASP